MGIRIIAHILLAVLLAFIHYRFLSLTVKDSKEIVVKRGVNRKYGNEINQRHPRVIGKINRDIGTAFCRKGHVATGVLA